MKHAPDEVTQNPTELLRWDVAGRDDARIARRLYRKQPIDGGYRLDAGVLPHDVFRCLEAVGVMALLEQVHGATIHGARVPCVQSGLRYELKTLCGSERIKALPSVLFSDEALIQLVGFHARQVRQGNGQRWATQQQGEHRPLKADKRALLDPELYQHIGQPKVELDWLKKSWTARSSVRAT